MIYYFIGGKVGVNEIKNNVKEELKIQKGNHEARKENRKFISYEALKDELTKHFESEDLSMVNISDIDKYVEKNYPEQADLINNGIIVSTDMNPTELSSTKVEIVRELNQDDKYKDYLIGLPQRSVKVNIKSGKIQSKPTQVEMGNLVSPNAYGYTKINNHEVTYPSMLLQTISIYGSTPALKEKMEEPLQEYPVLVWVKANKNDTFKDLKETINQIKIKVFSTQAKKAFEGVSDNEMSEMQSKLKEYLFFDFFVKNFEDKIPDDDMKLYEDSMFPVLFMVNVDSLATLSETADSIDVYLNDKKVQIKQNETIKLN